MEKIGKSIQGLKITDEENNFSSLKSLIECHQKSEVDQDLQNQDSDKTLAEFSQSFLTYKIKNFQSADEKPKKFVIPKLTPKKDENPENWVIDLTCALKSVDKLNQIQSFPRTFPNQAENDIGLLKIKPDIIRDSFLEFNLVDTESSLNAKSCSPFGKILCRKWRYSRPRISFLETILPQRIVRFDFATPSPDDLILKHLRRK